MLKITPGRWKVETHQEPYNSCLLTYQVVSDQGLVVAKCGTGDWEIPHNAKLIAAAPEIYDALVEVLGYQSLAPADVIQSAQDLIDRIENTEDGNYAR